MGNSYPTNFMLDEVLIEGIGDISRELEREFRLGFAMDAAMAKKRQIEAAQARRTLGLVAKSNLRLSIDPFWYHYWGQREGYEIWQDEKEVNRFIRDTPELRVETEKAPRVSFAGCESLPVLEGKPIDKEERMLVV